MKRIAQSVLLALTALALGACTSTGMQGDTARTSSTADSDYGRPADYSAGASSAMGSSGATGTTSSGAADQAGQPGVTAGAPNSTVSTIEVIPRQSGDAAAGAGSVAGAAVGGTTGSSGSDRVYRITLQMDDGNVRTITQETAPSFSPGDRVRVADGVIMR